MSMPRRNIIRPAVAVAAGQQHQRQLQRLRSRLDNERTALARWQPRLRRAFTTVEKCMKKIARLERQIAQLEP
jgi:septal ring factor EnvC (AmiA/AmiB activator)